MNEETKKLIEETTIDMVMRFHKSIDDLGDGNRHHLVSIMISVLTSINATLIHSYCDTVMKHKKIDIGSKDYREEYVDCFGDFMMKIGGNTFGTCIAKMETIENKEVH